MNNQAIDMFQRTVKFEHDTIWVKPVCDFFEVSYENATRRISDDPIMASESTKKSNELLFGDKRLRISLTKKGFIRWIQLVNANTIRDDLQEQFIQYQSFVFDFLYGSAEDHQQTKILYQRQKKLKHLYGKIGRELQTVDSQLEGRLDQKYLQSEMQFQQVEDGRGKNDFDKS